MKAMSDYTNFCSEEQTKRAYKLGAPIRVHRDAWRRHNEGEQPIDIGTTNGFTTWLMTPTTQQMIGWLRTEKDIDICIGNTSLDYRFNVWHRDELIKELFVSRYEYEYGELAAIDAALDYLEKGGIK